MSALKKAEEKAQRQSAKKRAEKMQLKGFMYAGALGFAEGYAEKSGWKIVTEGFGPVKFEYLQAVGGYYLATKKKGDERELGEALAMIGIYKIGKGFGGGFELGGFLGGGS